jgi:hypothetical protein
MLMWAQPSSTESHCSETTVLSVPSRPTIASATDPTQCGVVEAEYGFERQWPGGGVHRDDLTGGLRMGLTPNMDLHWASGAYLNVADSSGTQRGFGDTWLGVKYRFLLQTRKRPSLGVFYQAKVPSGDSALGLGSGQVDHAIAFLVSKDIHPFHFDFNVILSLVGRTVGGGFDHNVGFAWATWLPVSKKLTLVAEPYGYSALNQSTAGFSSVMAGVSYQLRPRCFLDTGIDVGIMHGAPNKRVYVGATYAVANVYSFLTPAR